MSQVMSSYQSSTAHLLNELKLITYMSTQYKIFIIRVWAFENVSLNACTWRTCRTNIWSTYSSKRRRRKKKKNIWSALQRSQLALPFISRNWEATVYWCCWLYSFFIMNHPPTYMNWFLCFLLPCLITNQYRTSNNFFWMWCAHTYTEISQRSL